AQLAERHDVEAGALTGEQVDDGEIGVRLERIADRHPPAGAGVGELAVGLADRAGRVHEGRGAVALGDVGEPDVLGEQLAIAMGIPRHRCDSLGNGDGELSGGAGPGRESASRAPSPGPGRAAAAGRAGPACRMRPGPGWQPPGPRQPGFDDRAGALAGSLARASRRSRDAPGRHQNSWSRIWSAFSPEATPPSIRPTVAMPWPGRVSV